MTIDVSNSRRDTAWLLAATLVAYANSCFGVFQFDDAGIMNDPRLAGRSAFLAHLPGMIRPVLKLTFLIDRRLYGGNPVGYHLLNVLLHAACGLLLYKLLTQALTQGPFSGSQFLQRLPFFAALLFLVHPIQTETVTYLSGRATGLMSFFYLLSFFLFLRSTRSQFPSRTFLACYAGALVSFMLALLTKEAAVTLPGALLLWTFVLPPGTAGDRRPSVRWHVPFWGVLVVALGLGLSHPRYLQLARTSLEIRSVHDNLLTQLHAAAYSLSLFFLPARLNFDHDLPEFHSFFQWPVAAGALILGGMIVGAFWARRRAPFVSFGILWFFLQILPANSFVPRYDILSERNLYLPSIGIFISVAALLMHIAEKFCSPQRSVAPAVIKVAALLTISALLLCTISRNRIYRDQVTFWSDAVGKSARKARTHNNLGYAYYVAGDLDRALDEFRLALALNRDFAGAQRNLLEVWKLKQSRLGRSLP